MRDANRLKERVELQLDRRQVTSIALVLLVLIGTAFAVGVMVGKNLVPRGKQGPPAGSLLDRLDQVQVDAGAAEGLTFQEELTRRTPPERPAPAPAVVHAPPPKVEHVAAPVVNLPVLSDDAGELEVAVAPKAPPKVPPTAQPKADPAPTAVGASFTLQVKATQSQSEAEKFAAKLRLQGYHSSVAEADVPGKGHWYRVRVGRFENRAQAERYLGDFERETHLSAFITAGGH